MGAGQYLGLLARQMMVHVRLRKKGLVWPHEALTGGSCCFCLLGVGPRIKQACIELGMLLLVRREWARRLLSSLNRTGLRVLAPMELGVAGILLFFPFQCFYY